MRKHSYRVGVAGLFAALSSFGCSSSGDAQSGSGGSSSSSGGTATAQGGANPGAGGSTTTTYGGSSTGSGGSANGSGGSPSGSGGATTSGSGGSTSPGSGGATASGGSASSEGGASTSSGGATGSAGSAAGGAPAVKLCATKAKASATFVDFESYDGKAKGSEWAFSPVTNSYAGFWAGGTPTPALDILAGHGGNYGMTVSATQATGTWAGIGTWMNPVTCLDATAFTGVSIWVKGSTPTGKFELAVLTEDTTLPDSMNPAAGGTCTGSCKSPTASDLPVTADWAQVTIPWAMFVGGMNGTTPVTLNGDKITGFGINFGFVYGLNPAYDANDPNSQEYIPMPGDIAFSFDDLTFTQ